MSKSKTKSDHEFAVYKKTNDMVWSIIRNKSEGYRHINEHDKKDIHARTMHLIVTRLDKKFDKNRNTKFTTYVYDCSRNFISRSIERAHKKKHRINVDTENYAKIITVGSQEQSCLIPGVTKLKEQAVCFSEWLRKNMEKFTKAEKRLVGFILRNSNLDYSQISKKMKYRYPSGVAMCLLRIRKKVMNCESFKEEVL